MHIYLKIAILGIWLLRTIKAALFHVWLWQLKEYRIDRFIDHLKFNKNRKRIFSKLFFARVFIMLFALILEAIIEDYVNIPVEFRYFMIGAISLIFTLEILVDLFKRNLKRPKFTKKAILIIGLAVLIEVITIILILRPHHYDYELSKFPPLFYASGTLSELISFGYFPLILTFSLSPLIAVLIIIFKPVTYLAKLRIFKKAKRKISAFPDLKVIGITGSYGKTSTKELLYTLLSHKFEVLKTAEHNNSEIGVAQTVLNKLDKKHQIFIAEMGAYKRGEIKTICKMIRPQIGIITGINEQHLSLFGSFENIKKAKYELVESLPENGLAVFNGDNESCVEMYNKTEIKKVMYSKNRKTEIYADQIKITEDLLSFLLYYKEECKKIEVALLGKHNVENILAACAVALKMGMTLFEIAEAAKNIKPLEKTMKLIKAKEEIKIIDDTYNANSDGIIAALEYMRIFPDHLKKVIIMPSMLELGKQGGPAHERVGEKIGEICNIAIFLDAQYIKELKTGIAKNLPLKTKIFIENNPKKILEIIKQKAGYGSIILFESRGAEKVIRELE